MNSFLPPDVATMIAQAEAAAKRSGAEQQQPSLPILNASQFAGRPVPERRFHDSRGMIPASGVTLLYGDGGTGKSLLALQLAVATVTNTPWIGVSVNTGDCLYFSCEDDETEIHIRLDAILRASGVNFTELAGLNIANMVGKNCLLAQNTRKGIIQETSLMADLKAEVEAMRPSLIIIDNAIDVFGGDSNDGVHVKQFMHQLTGLSIHSGCPIVLLAHPSKSGMSGGTGDGGSVHWSNSSRSRLYLSRNFTTDESGAPYEVDPCARSLKVMKANYSATGEAIELRWHEGVMGTSAPGSNANENAVGQTYKAERVFMKLLRWHEGRGTVSAHQSPTYAPTVFAAHRDSERVTKRQFLHAMQSLMEAGKISEERHGPPSRIRSRLVINDGAEVD